MASASFQLSSDGGSTWHDVDTSFADADALAYNASGTYSCKAKFNSVAGIGSYSWTFTSADDQHIGSLPAITVDPVTKIASFSIPKTGGAWILTAEVNGGLDPATNETSSTLRKSLAIKVLFDNGQQVIAVNEGLEANTVWGYTKAVNDKIRAADGGGGGGGDPRIILWDPDNATPNATKGEAKTWADVEALVTATSGPAIVYVLPGTSATYDVDGTFDGQDSTLCSTSGSPEINVVDGEAIQNMRLEGITLRGNNTTASTGCWTSSQTEWHAKRVAFINDGSAPIVWTRFGTIYLVGGCTFDDTSASEVLELDTSAAIVSLRITGGFELGADTVKGVGSSSLIFRHDGTITALAAQANFAGDAYNCPLGTNGGAGPHSFRPRAITGYDLPDGCTYRHTGLGSTVTWNATGARWEVTSGDGAFPSIARYLRGAIAGAAGSYTTGNGFKPNRERYITGVRFIWVTAGGSAENVKVSIWKGGVSVHSQTFSISAGTTFNELTFTSAYHVAGGDERTEFHVTTWETGGSRYCKQFTVGPPAWHAGAIPVGDHEWTAANHYAAGDANPASTAGSETYSIEPIYGMEA